MSLPNQNEVDSLTHLVHISWTAIHDELGALNPLVLSRNHTLAKNIAEAEQYTAVHANQKPLNAAVALASGTCDELRVELVEAIGSIRTEIKYIAPIVGNEGFFNALPKPLKAGSAVPKVLAASETCAAIWEQLLGLTHPDLTQPVRFCNGQTLEQFQARIEVLRAAYHSRLNAVAAAKTNRRLRDQILKQVFAHIVEYRLRVIRAFPKDSIHRQNLPVLYRSRGAAPEAVTVTGIWNADTGNGKLIWSECTSTNLSHYEVRGCLQGTYATDEDIVVARVPKGTLSFETSFGLTAVGSVASFKVYAVTTTGRERGSNSVSIERLAIQQAA
ncbi:MAG: hypothetical protein SFY80_16150 [Verrucomicrobiota bacterium]|nr:hypothetical protein [Verrucomicrobiota bacterium]